MNKIESSKRGDCMLKELIEFFQKASLKEVTKKLKQYGVKFTNDGAKVDKFK